MGLVNVELSTFGLIGLTTSVSFLVFMGVGYCSRREKMTQTQSIQTISRSTLEDQYLSTASHELRAPMANITMAIQMISVALEKDGFLDRTENQKLSRYLRILQSESKREVNLINDLLDLGRLGADYPLEELESVSLGVYIPCLLEPFEIRSHERSIEFQVLVPQDLPAYWTEIPSFERILTELFNNACKYTPDGQSIRVSAAANPEGIEIKVQNTGVSIPSVDLERVFDRFYRGKSTNKDQGSGLGLTLVQELVHRLGGSITACSDDTSTTFQIFLPYLV